MAFIAGPPDPRMPCRCERCGWNGLIGDCDLQPDELVRCPLCYEPVTVDRRQDEGSRSDNYKHLGGPHIAGA